MKVKKVLKKMERGERVRIETSSGSVWQNCTVGDTDLIAFMDEKVKSISTGYVFDDVDKHDKVPTVVIYIKD